MNSIRFISGVLIIILFPAVQFAQSIDSMMNVYADNYPQEKVYLQFDKNVYNPGETIWFKAYLFIGGEPSLLSKNFYAELADENGNIIQKKTAPMFESTAAGNFDIPQGFKGSRVHIRAYTSWMLNFDTAFIFEKDIRLLNAAKDSSARAAPSPEYFFQVFPEGGDLVATLENNIAFKATDQFGLPIKVKGVVKDISGKDILEFNAVHDGMGKFLITPDKGDSLYALWKDEKGTEHRTNFPEIKPDGIALRAMSGNKKIFFSVARSADRADDYSRLTLIAHMNQQLIYKAIINLKENFMSGGAIPTDQLPTGVVQITVFNNNNLPLAERVVFVNNHSYEFSPDLFVGTKNLAKRGKNTIDIVVPDTLRSNLSVAVTDAEADGKRSNDDNIISRLLLTGDLRGYVHDPSYYFSNTADSTANYLDLVLMTHGWRRFKWDQLARGKIPVIKFPPENNYLSIKAEVFGVDVSRIPKDESINVILQRKDSSVQMLDLPKLAGGKFGISGLRFYDTSKAFYQFNLNRKLSTESAVVFSNGLFSGYRKIKPVPFLNTGWSPADSALARRNRFIVQESAKINEFQNRKVQTLETVTVRKTVKTAAQKLDEEYTSGLFSGGDAYNFDLSNDPLTYGYPDIFTYLQGKVAGLQITNNGSNTSLTWRGSTPTVYLNEMPIDISGIRSIPVSDVALVKVFRPGAAMGIGGGGGGTIAVYTKKGEKRIDPTIKGLEQARIVGYSVTKEFFSPNYAQIDDLSTVEDVRSTLYWKPYVLTDKSNPKITLQFYNNDITKKFRIVLEGINAEGKMTRIEKIVQ